MLRGLQEKEFQRVGEVKDIRADVRILASTNRDLRQALQNGGFREDLYYRLNVASLPLPPIESLKRGRIKKALAATYGSQTKAAQILGLPQSNLSRLMKKLGLR